MFTTYDLQAYSLVYTRLPLPEEIRPPKAVRLSVSLDCPGRRSSPPASSAQDRVTPEDLAPLHTAGAAWSRCREGAYNSTEKHKENNARVIHGYISL